MYKPLIQCAACACIHLHTYVAADEEGRILGDMYTLDVSGYASEEEDLIWRDASGQTSIPPVTMHTMTVVQGPPWYMVVFGGQGAGLQASSDLHILNLEDSAAKWQDMSESPGAPQARFGHGAAASPGRLYVYGGWTAAGRAPESDLHVLDVATVTWKSLAKLPGRPGSGSALFGMAAVSTSGCRVSHAQICTRWLHGQGVIKR